MISIDKDQNTIIQALYLCGIQNLKIIIIKFNPLLTVNATIHEASKSNTKLCTMKDNGKKGTFVVISVTLFRVIEH